LGIDWYKNLINHGANEIISERFKEIGLFLLNNKEGIFFIISGDPTGRTAYSAIVPALP